MKLLLFYLLTLIALPQTMRSGTQEKLSDDTQRVNALGIIVTDYFNHNEFEKAKPYADEIRNLAKITNDPYTNTLAAYCDVVYLMKENNLDSVFSGLLRADSLMETLPDDDRSNYLRYLINNRFFYYYYTYQRLPQAFDVLEKNIQLWEKMRPGQKCSALSRRLLMLYSEAGQNEEALRVGRELVHYVTDSLSMCYNCLSLIGPYLDKGDPDSAMMYVDSAFLYDRYRQLSWGIYDQKGMVYRQMGDETAAYACFDSMYRCLGKDYISTEDSLYITYRYLWSKALMLKSQCRYDSALYCIDNALETVGKFVSLGNECEIMQLKTDLLDEAGRYKEALDNMRACNLLSDSLANSKNVLKVETKMFQQRMRAYEVERQHEQYVRESKHRANLLVLAIIALALLSGCVIMVLLMKRRKLKQDLLEEELEDANRELASTAVVMMKKNEAYSEVIATLKSLEENISDWEAQKTLSKVSKRIEQTMEEGYYDEFDVRFKRVHPDFIAKLTKQHPDLTPNEIKICSFLKLNMSTKEIAALTGQTVRAVEMSRFRIRRKLGLSSDDHAHLSQYIMKI